MTHVVKATIFDAIAMMLQVQVMCIDHDVASAVSVHTQTNEVEANIGTLCRSCCFRP